MCILGKIRATSEHRYIFSRETVALEKPDAFFTFLDRLTETEALMSPAAMTPKAIHQAALKIALDNGILEERDTLSAVEMNLALHAATPKLEAFYNHYEDHHNNSRGTQCGSWVDWYGEVVCDAERLAQLAEEGTTIIPSDLKTYVFLSVGWHPFSILINWNPVQAHKHDPKFLLLTTYFHLPIA